MGKDSIEISIEKYLLEINDHSNFFFAVIITWRKAYVLFKRTWFIVERVWKFCLDLVDAVTRG